MPRAGTLAEHPTLCQTVRTQLPAPAYSAMQDPVTSGTSCLTHTLNKTLDAHAWRATRAARWLQRWTGENLKQHRGLDTFPAAWQP